MEQRMVHQRVNAFGARPPQRHRLHDIAFVLIPYTFLNRRITGCDTAITAGGTCGQAGTVLAPVTATVAG